MTDLPRRLILAAAALALSLSASAQWTPDNGDGTYRNPILYADYSDPDVIRVGDDYWMVASSFACMPGIPVLHSRDLVGWEIVNHVYGSFPLEKYDKPCHGQGSWAPSIRYHDGMYYVYFCTPNDGLYVAKAADPRGKWEMTQVLAVEKWEDPCPFWDEDGQAYLVHSIHRGGPAVLHRMSEDGTRLLDNGVTVYQDEQVNPVLEGLKMDKRNGWYYIFAPAGGVETGWQTVLRSRNIYGPYEAKVVLHAGDNGINGPHQGGLVETQTGEWWFMHFQSRDPWGRIVNLEPACWQEDGWPLIGIDTDNDGIGEPVLGYRKPDVGKNWPAIVPQTSDDFRSKSLGKQWQWLANPQKEWYSLSERPGYMRLRAVNCPTEKGNLYYAGNLLLQKFAAPSFSATTRVEAQLGAEGERCGLIVMGNIYSYIALIRGAEGMRVAVVEGKMDKFAVVPVETASEAVAADRLWLRVTVDKDALCRYSYSLDGKTFRELGEACRAHQGTWIGAKTGIFCSSPNVAPAEGYADFDFFRVGE